MLLQGTVNKGVFMNPFLAGALGVGSIFSGLFGASSADKASEAQQGAIKQAEGQLTGYLTQSLGYQQPIYQQGMQSLANVGQGMQAGSYNVNPYNYQTQPFNFQADPGYQFTLGQGQQAINANAARNGTQLSSGNMKNLATFTTGLAGQTYNASYNRYLQGQGMGMTNAMNTFQSGSENAGQRFGMGMNLANLGVGAANNMGNLTSAYGTNIAELLGQGGTAKASGIMGQAGQIGGMFNNLGTLGMLSSMYKPYQIPVTTPVPGATK